MDDNHGNFMTYIIASGANTIATFTDEECSQVDMYLNVPPHEDDVVPVKDTTTNIEDILETTRKVL
jgi:molybdopterin biosynthesis enzyme